MNTQITQNSRKANTMFRAVSISGLLLILTELVMQAFGGRICVTEGCKLVAQYVRFGDTAILFLGAATFFAFTLLSSMQIRQQKPEISMLINMFLVIALACEGFFTGYQAFRLFVPCYFCLVIFSLLVILGLIRLFSGHIEILAGLGSFAGVFFLFYLVLPVGVTGKLPAEQMMLFYSAECKYCVPLMKEIEEKNVKIPHVLVSEYPGLLKSFGIEVVPTLMINTPAEKRFISGAQNIRAFLFPSVDISKKPAVKKNPGPGKPIAGKRTANNNTPARSSENPGILDIFNEPEGTCKENEDCK